LVERLEAAHLHKGEEGQPCRPEEQFPPPIATSEPPPRWRELPPVNRRQLLVSLSHLLEYRLEEPATMPKRGVKDHDRG
jgi:hypothetical protein